MSDHKNYRAARKIRRWLRRQLGYVCAGCGKRKAGMQFDVVIPVHPPDGHGRRLSWDQRMRYYRRHYERGNLRILCITCNCTKGSTQDKQYHAMMRQTGEDEPTGEALTSTVDYDAIPF